MPIIEYDEWEDLADFLKDCITFSYYTESAVASRAIKQLVIVIELLLAQKAEDMAEV
jgi:hypothetical protein